MKKYSKEDQRLMAIWAIDCAQRVLPLFENAMPDDDRPREAIETGRTWIQTGVFKMTEIRRASLAAHAAARGANGSSAAGQAAHAAGQAVATAHVTQHAFGGAYYALKAVAAAYPDRTWAEVAKERAWQLAHAPAALKDEVERRVVARETARGVYITVDKSADF